MPERSEPQSVGSVAGPEPRHGHGLGPHVVGVRVVVRRLLPGESGPSGGPAMTDLLGVCEAYGDGVLLVRPDTGGEPVSIPLEEVVTGKPVPPRGSVRDRVAAVDAQRRAFALFPDLRTEPVGGWVLRDSTTASARRATTALAFGPPGVPDAVGRVVAFYEALGRRPAAAVLPDSAQETLLRGAGWVVVSSADEVLFLVAGTAPVARALRGLDHPAAELVEEVPGRWTRVVLGDPARPLATGYAGSDGEWAGVGGLLVDPAHRRRGLARAVLAELVGWAAEHGATTLHLQVLAENRPARALYEGLGFRTHHTYRYLSAPLG